VSLAPIIDHLMQMRRVILLSLPGISRSYFYNISSNDTFQKEDREHYIYISRDHLLNMSKLIKFQADLREILS